MKQSGRFFAWGAFLAYAAWMVWLLFLQRIGHTSELPYLQQVKGNLNLIPLQTIREFVQDASGSFDPAARASLVRHAWINLAGNIVMFIPLGFFLPCLAQKFRFYSRFLLWQLAIITAIELIQLFTLWGSCDVDDLILNTLGAAIGFLGYQVFPRIRSKRNAQLR